MGWIVESGPQKVDAVNSEKGQSLGKVIQEGFLEEEEVIVLSNWEWILLEASLRDASTPPPHLPQC